MSAAWTQARSASTWNGLTRIAASPFEAGSSDAAWSSTVAALVPKELDAVGQVGRSLDVVVVESEAYRHRAPDRGVVLDDQNMGHMQGRLQV
jgi:hypothetical protein